MNSDDPVQKAAVRIRARFKTSREVREYLAEVAVKLVDEEPHVPEADLVEVKAVRLVLAAALNAQKAAARKAPRLGYRGQPRLKLVARPETGLDRGKAVIRDGPPWLGRNKLRHG